jgi:hypothetical protein
MVSPVLAEPMRRPRTVRRRSKGLTRTPPTETRSPVATSAASTRANPSQRCTVPVLASHGRAQMPMAKHAKVTATLRITRRR